MKKLKVLGFGVVATGMSAILMGIPGLVICGGIGVTALIHEATKQLKDKEEQ